MHKVRHHQSSGSKNGDALKEGNDGHFLPTMHMAFADYGNSENDIAHQQDIAKPSERIILEQLAPFSLYGSEYEIEIHTTDKHKYRQYDDDVGTVPIRHGQVFGRKSSSRESGKAMANSLK